MVKQSKMRDMRPIQEAASRALWQACNKPDLCRHAVAIVVSREVAEWDTPLTLIKNGGWASSQRTNFSMNRYSGLY
jgi:hypothetical protein